MNDPGWHDTDTRCIYFRNWTLAFPSLSGSYVFLRLANPFGHPSQVRTQVLVLQTCVDLRRLASPFGQGFRDVKIYIFWLKRHLYARNTLRLRIHSQAEKLSVAEICFQMKISAVVAMNFEQRFLGNIAYFILYLLRGNIYFLVLRMTWTNRTSHHIHTDSFFWCKCCATRHPVESLCPSSGRWNGLYCQTAAGLRMEHAWSCTECRKY